MPTLLIQQIRLQWYKDCRGGNYAVQRNQYPRAFFSTDGSGQSMIVLFAPEGCVINGVDSELYDWEKNSPESKT